ncbi:drug/metabolite transporter (DMT)-like permease [Novosphingobium kunmingense]|uniref:Drug/metabolite transporter (DMT)-like permease n=1 Tax=Novosphingobium kunmingense TaxID=1211806 RepID=A0A2N0H3X3_9SPHN|nr:DMT family transporter [Novosphingobium kunmingense]PKB13635.1 drug/metabolite transporter (DMT)-like permease [Novosphingobium kunmingense]
MQGSDQNTSVIQGLGSKLWQAPALLLCLASFFWALNPIVGRAAKDMLSPVTLAFWRWVVALVFVIPFAWRHARADWPVIAGAWRFLGLLGAFGVGLFSFLVYQSLQFTTATNNLLLQSTMPVMTLLMPVVLFRERVRPIFLACALLSIAGVVWIMTAGQPNDLRWDALNSGDLLSVSAVFLYSAYATFLRRAPAMHHLSLLVVLFGVGIATLCGPYSLHLLRSGLTVPSPAAVCSLLYVGIFPSLVSYALFNRAVALIGSGRAGLYMNLPSVFGLLMAVPLLGERFEPYHLIGAFMVVGSILLSRQVRT